MAAVYGRIYAAVGCHDEAFDLLRDLLGAASRVIFNLLRLDPAFDPFRRRPGFAKLIE